MDDLDRNLLDLFAAEPRIGVLEASRRLGVARGTVQARLDKLAATGVVTGWGPTLDPAAMGHPRHGVPDPGDPPEQGGHDPVGARLAGIPEVLEACTITGAGRHVVRVVARSNTDLQRVIDAVLASRRGALATVIALATQVPYRVCRCWPRAADEEAQAQARIRHDAWATSRPVSSRSRGPRPLVLPCARPHGAPASRRDHAHLTGVLRMRRLRRSLRCRPSEVFSALTNDSVENCNEQADDGCRAGSKSNARLFASVPSGL